MLNTLEAPVLHQKQNIEKLTDPSVGLKELLEVAGIDGLDEKARLTLIEHATLDDYMTAIDIVHQKVAPEAGTAILEWSARTVDPRTGETASVLANPVERVDIMHGALERAKQVVKRWREEGGEIQDALVRCANLLGFGVVLAHNYEDGSGRTARTIGEVIHKGYDSSDPQSVANLEIISTNRSLEGSKILSYMPTGEWQHKADIEPLEFLDVVAALDQPLDGVSYSKQMAGVIQTPRMA